MPSDGSSSELAAENAGDRRWLVSPAGALVAMGSGLSVAGVLVLLSLLGVAL